MEHFQFRKKNVTNNDGNVEISNSDWKTALESLNEVCYFEYNRVTDTFWLSRDYNFTKENGTKITDFSKKVERFGCIASQQVDEIVSFLTDGNREKIEFKYKKIDGTYIWCMAKVSFIKNQNEKIVAMVGRIHDIDQEKQLQEMLVEQALLDPLTKLYSKERAQNLIEHFLRADGSFGKHTLMIINVVGMKKLNQTYGEAFGDQILKNLAEQLRNSFRKKDIIARIGGDDFQVFMKDTTEDAILEQKIESILHTVHKVYENETVDVYCTIGISKFPEHGRVYSKLLQKADYALYRGAKYETNYYAIYQTSFDHDSIMNNNLFLHNYSFEPVKTKTLNVFSNGLLSYAFDQFLQSSNITVALKKVLKKVGCFYKCDSISIWEIDDENFLHLTQLWSDSEHLSNHYNQIEFFNMDSFPIFHRYFDDRGVRAIDNTQITEQNPELRDFINFFHATALLQCAFYEKKKCRGLVSIAYNYHTHNWTKDEIDTVILISKICSVFLLRFKQAEQAKNKLENMKKFDQLTQLPRLKHFRENVELQLRNNSHSTYAILNVDIHKFKYINDTLGYEVGDEILKEISKCISTGAYDIVMSARDCADKFVVLMNYVNDKQIEKNILDLNRIFKSRMQSFSIGNSVYIVAGVAKLKSGMDFVSVLDNANIARKKAKKIAGSHCCFYDEKLEAESQLELEISNSMQRAYEHKEFQMYLQPKINLQTGKIVGAEALTRWIKKDGSVYVPDQFIPLFEKNGFIVQLDFYIYNCACKLLQDWITLDITPVTISLNVSRVHLQTDDFVKKINHMVDRHQIPHQYLEFELTESIFLDQTEIALQTMHGLRESGYSVAIDDFGAGFSSLNLLKDMTTDVLKLDKDFFRKGNMQKEEKIIVSSITNMAKQLEMKVLSEGVETEAQSNFLRDISCDMAQGYLFAKPMPKEEFTKLLKKEMA